MRSSMKRYSTLLIKYLAPQWQKTIFMFLSLIFGIILQLAGPQILSYFIDTGLQSGFSSSLLLAGILFIGITFIKQGVSIAAVYFSEYVAWTATNQLRIDLLAHCFSLDIAFFKEYTSGEFIERIDGDVTIMANFFSSFVINLFGNALLLAGILVLLLRINIFLGASVTLFAIIDLLMLLYLRSRYIPLWTHLRQMSADFFGFLSEHLAGTEDIRANGAVHSAMRRFYLLLRRWSYINRKAKSAGNLLVISTVTAFNLGIALVLALSAFLWSKGSITIGTAYLIYAYTGLLFMPIRQIQAQMQDLQQAEASMQRVDKLFQIKPTIRDTECIPLPQGSLAIDFKNVSFGYTADAMVIHDLTFHVQPGTTLAILGRTGSGKTTLARLLLRLYEPQAGEILLNGIRLNATAQSDLRSRVSVVTQDIQLFHATVRDNLTLFNRSITDEQILKALAEVELSSWFNRLPAGLDSLLESNSKGLSAGEAQLLAFARIFLTNPDVIILDEASSRLDPRTDLLIQQAIKKLLMNRTGIVIAHRFTTLQNVDHILLLENGRILEHGPKNQLEANPDSHFARLLQFGSDIEAFA